MHVFRFYKRAKRSRCSRGGPQESRQAVTTDDIALLWLVLVFCFTLTCMTSKVLLKSSPLVAAATTTGQISHSVDSWSQELESSHKPNSRKVLIKDEAKDDDDDDNHEEETTSGRNDNNEKIEKRISEHQSRHRRRRLLEGRRVDRLEDYKVGRSSSAPSGELNSLGEREEHRERKRRVATSSPQVRPGTRTFDTTRNKSEPKQERYKQQQRQQQRLLDSESGVAGAQNDSGQLKPDEIEIGPRSRPPRRLPQSEFSRDDDILIYLPRQEDNGLDLMSLMGSSANSENDGGELSQDDAWQTSRFEVASQEGAGGGDADGGSARSISADDAAGDLLLNKMANAAAAASAAAAIDSTGGVSEINLAPMAPRARTTTSALDNRAGNQNQGSSNGTGSGVTRRDKAGAMPQAPDKDYSSLPAATSGETTGAGAAAAPIMARRFCIYYPGLNLWHCQGFRMTSVPDELSPKPISLLLSTIGIETLCRKHLEPYKESLRDFSIENAPNLTVVERGVFDNWTRLRVLRIQRTGLNSWPNLSEFKQEKILTSVDLDNNRIESLGSRPINIRAELVNLEFNLLKSIDEFTFNGSEIGALSLANNRQLSFIHANAFANLKNLIKLDLSSTSVAQLPTVGLQQLRQLTIRDNYALRQIPSIYVFPMLEEAHLTYAYHCCSFRYPQTHDPSAYEEHLRLQEAINSICGSKQQQQLIATGHSGAAHEKVPATAAAASTEESAPSLKQQASTSTTTESSGFEGYFETGEQQAPNPFDESAAFSIAIKPPSGLSNVTTTASYGLTKSNLTYSKGVTLPTGRRGHPDQLWNVECGELVLNASVQNITCTPEPDAFNPCEDIMGYPVLRFAVWFVVACSVFGNLSVIVVLLGIFRRLSVPKFLQLNLAIGDLVMGFYLSMLAAADLTTVGTYFNYAFDWQHGLGCRIAGASSLFASQLSIFTLIVITFERYYTITYTIDLNMRLQLGWAARIMLFGWIYAFGAAMLPIFGNINSYSKTSICLPMRTAYKMDRIFIVVLLIIDSCAFLIIFICYLRMYLLILKQKTEATLKERTVAMRMALLVFTDFACWAPIIFFGATAIFGHPLISVTNSKILIVFFYPLNSMANPFLYVLSTRQYRRDLNYVINRLRHWRKNLFRSQSEKDFSFNTNNAYGAMIKYQPAMYAQLGDVAAMTGVANHLHHYRLPLDCLDEDNAAAANNADSRYGGQQVELIKFGPDSNGDAPKNRHNRHCASDHQNSDLNNVEEQQRNKHQHRHCRCNHRHHHHNKRHQHKRGAIANGNTTTRLNEQCLACTGGGQGCQVKDDEKCMATQYIIRHRILPGARRSPGSQSNSTSRSRLTRMAGRHQQQQQQNTANCLASSPKRQASPAATAATEAAAVAAGAPLPSGTVKLGHVIDDNNERVTSLIDSKEELNGPSGCDGMSDASKVVLVDSAEMQASGDATPDVDHRKTAEPEKVNRVSSSHLSVVATHHHHHNHNHRHRHHLHHYRHKAQRKMNDTNDTVVATRSSECETDMARTVLNDLDYCKNAQEEKEKERKKEPDEGEKKRQVKSSAINSRQSLKRSLLRFSKFKQPTLPEINSPPDSCPTTTTATNTSELEQTSTTTATTSSCMSAAAAAANDIYRPDPSSRTGRLQSVDGALMDANACTIRCKRNHRRRRDYHCQHQDDDDDHRNKTPTNTKSQGDESCLAVERDSRQMSRSLDEANFKQSNERRTDASGRQRHHRCNRRHHRHRSRSRSHKSCPGATANEGSDSCHTNTEKRNHHHHHHHEHHHHHRRHRTRHRRTGSGENLRPAIHQDKLETEGNISAEHEECKALDQEDTLPNDKIKSNVIIE